MPSATPSPRGLSKLRRNNNKSDPNGSTNSLNLSSSNSDADASLRPTSSSGALDGGGAGKLMNRLRRRSVQEDGSRRGSEDVPTRRLSKLVPGRLKKSKKGADDDGELERNLSVDSTGYGNYEISGNRSESSLGPDLTGSGHSSLLTDGDSDTEG